MPDRPRPIVLHGAQVVDGSGRPPIRRGVVVVEGSRIGFVGPVSDSGPDLPQDALVVDLAGRTIVPGLIDLHVHSTFPSEMRAYLDHGVTSIRYAGIDRPAFRTIAKRVAKDDPPGPRLFTLGPMLDRDPPSWPEWSTTFATPEEAAETARRFIEIEKTDGLVATQGVQPADLQAIVDVAHEHNRPVMGQLWHTDAAEAAGAGIDQLDNTSRIAASRSVGGDALWAYSSVPERIGILTRLWLDVDWDETARLMDAMVARDVAYAATLVALEQQVGLHTDEVEGDPSFRTGFGEPELAAWDAFKKRVSGSTPDAHPENRVASLDPRREWMRRFHELGGRLLVGTDMPFGGLAIHRELAILREIGMTTGEVLAAATGGAARAMRVADRLGTIEPDKLADLVVVNGDPLADLADLRQIDLVLRDGQPVAGRLAAGLRIDPER